MTIKEFADRNNFRIRKDGYGDPIVLGKFTAKGVQKFPEQRKSLEYHNHVYDGFADGKLGVFVSFKTPRKYGSARQALLAAGCEPKQSAGTGKVPPGAEYPTEGCFRFDPSNAAQVATVAKVAGLKVQRAASPAMLAALEAARAIRKAA
jgi:hypothetical protein